METNSRLELAFDFLENTGKSIFLTGKAGTGKTTFLRELRVRSPKRMVILAPTGVAAINAGGVTIHSFFQLPFGPYVKGFRNGDVQGEKSISHKFNKEKVNIIRTMDLLVIDEISMVRADLLDAVSDVLCRYRDKDKPFGGVQLLMIGDLQQLAPVTKEDEWNLLKHHYETPFFFSSKALRELPYFTIELTHVYRQADPGFITLLNKIRDHKMDGEALEQLNKRYIPDFDPEEGYIMLTTHNYKAREINERKLRDLPGKAFTYKAEIKDSFPEYAFPTDHELVLKKGAQVMFIKNDTSPEKLYYNGKIGKISAIDEQQIRVSCDDGQPITVQKEEWTNTSYTIDPETNEITENILGTFRQYPLKPAWAITIHKSQGLTFEKAVIDASDAFAHGQVYVALSRCKSLEGLVLNRTIKQHALIADTAVREYSNQSLERHPDMDGLQRANREYLLSLLKDFFDYTALFRKLAYYVRLQKDYLQKLYPEFVAKSEEIREYCRKELMDVGNRFQQQLERLMSQSAPEDVLSERVERGNIYFTEKMGLIREYIQSDLPESDNKENRKLLEEAFYKLQKEVVVKTELLSETEIGFSIKGYLKARANALIHAEELKKKKKKKSEKKQDIPSDILHPRLYENLRKWRNEEAKSQNLPAYTVLHQRALLGIANTLPTGSKDLLAIPGVGKKVLERYGVKILEIIDRYRE